MTTGSNVTALEVVDPRFLDQSELRIQWQVFFYRPRYFILPTLKLKIEDSNGTCICLDFHSQLYMVHVYDLEHFHMYISLTTGVP